MTIAIIHRPKNVPRNLVVSFSIISGGMDSRLLLLRKIGGALNSVSTSRQTSRERATKSTRGSEARHSRERRER